ncbi:DUF1456 family protein [Moraxella osloensis]|nr:hypothetical protein [Moraxella osloensis]MBW4008594.1 DUF1456 family protein [Moraxella osloensis]
MDNQIFKRTLAITGLNRDEDLALQAFKLGGYHTASKSKIKAWRTLDTSNHRYQAMPNDALTAFFDGLLILAEQNIICCYIEKGE